MKNKNTKILFMSMNYNLTFCDLTNATKERENNKVSQFHKTRKERKQKFFAKKFLFSL
jgi:hypothetical protein